MYQNIFENVILPFSVEKFDHRMILHQDNDSKHSSKICQDSLNDLKIPWVNRIKKMNKILI